MTSDSVIKKWFFMLKKFLYLVILAGFCQSIACNKILNRKDEIGGAGPNSQYALVVKAEDFGEDLADLIRAKDKYDRYIGKRIEMSGTILNYSRDGNGVIILHFDTNKGESLRRGGIQCRMDDPQPWAGSHPGQQVRVAGTLKEIGLGATLENCQINETNGPQLAVLDAIDLEARYEKNMEAIRPHVYMKRFFVEGIVIEGKDVRGNPIPSLATNSKHPIAIEFPRFSNTENGRLKVGEKGRVLAVINGFGVGNYQVVLTDSLVISSTPVK